MHTEEINFGTTADINNHNANQIDEDQTAYERTAHFP